MTRDEAGASRRSLYRRGWVWLSSGMRFLPAREMRTCRGQISRTFETPGRFHCSRVSGGTFGQWRCVRGARAFRFEFGD
jgi:hypothetical protein